MSTDTLPWRAESCHPPPPTTLGSWETEVLLLRADTCQAPPFPPAQSHGHAVTWWRCGLQSQWPWTPHHGRSCDLLRGRNQQTDKTVIRKFPKQSIKPSQNTSHHPYWPSYTDYEHQIRISFGLVLLGKGYREFETKSSCIHSVMMDLVPFILSKKLSKCLLNILASLYEHLWLASIPIPFS